MRFRLPVGVLGLALIALLRSATPAAALEECRLLRQPDIQGDRIVFVYAGDLWTVTRAGGLAGASPRTRARSCSRSSRPTAGPSPSPAEYDGNTDAYTMPVEGGEPTRLTWHPLPDQVAEWYPDGKAILLRSRRASAMQRYDRFFKVPARGRLRGDAAAAHGRLRLALARRRPDRLRLALLRQPHLEALPGRRRPADLDLRLPAERLGEDHRLARARRVADVARATRSTTPPTAAGARSTSGPTTSTRRPTARSRSSTSTTSSGRASAPTPSCSRTAASSTSSTCRARSSRSCRSSSPTTSPAPAPSTATSRGGSPTSTSRPRPSARCSRRAATCSPCRPRRATCAT